MRVINTGYDPVDCGRHIFKNKTQSFEPGLTVLCGCNGYGKTTLLRCIETELTKNKTPFFKYDDRHDGETIIGRKLNFDIAYLATHVCSSEGERIVMHMNETVNAIGSAIRKAEGKEFWILLDTIDSGLSINNIVEFKDFFRFLLEHESDKEIYIVVSSNTYEMCNGERCRDCYTGKDIQFKNYDEYREFILNTSKIKER